MRCLRRGVAIAGSENLSTIIFNLIGWAESTGKLEELIRGAYRQNPDNPKLIDFCCIL